MSDQIIENFNVEYINRFFEPIIDKSLFFIWMNGKWYEIVYQR
ncbi:MAG: hypothetical protein ACTS8P_03545 [Arsenophonus sp. NC-XBC3-MAG3]